MSIDYTAYMAIGVKLTEEEVQSLENKFDDYIDEMFDVTTDDEFRNNLAIIKFGTESYPEYVISINSDSSEFEATKFSPYLYDRNRLPILQRFCKENGIHFEVNHYFGILQW